MIHRFVLVASTAILLAACSGFVPEAAPTQSFLVTATATEEAVPTQNSSVTAATEEAVVHLISQGYVLREGEFVLDSKFESYFVGEDELILQDMSGVEFPGISGIAEVYVTRKVVVGLITAGGEQRRAERAIARAIGLLHLDSGDWVQARGQEPKVDSPYCQVIGLYIEDNNDDFFVLVKADEVGENLVLIDGAVDYGVQLYGSLVPTGLSLNEYVTIYAQATPRFYEVQYTDALIGSVVDNVVRITDRDGELLGTANPCGD